MARLSGVTIPNDKQIHVALTYVFGIGPKTSVDILSSANIDGTVRVKDLTDAEISRIQDIINANYTVEGELQRGLRHKNSLPSRGQRTKTNARTRRGKKVTVGGTAKKVASKT